MAHIRGDLNMDEITKLEAHIKTCASCQEEADDLRWFLTGTRHNAMAITEGHISSRLLYEFVEGHTTLEPGTMDRIENHLKTCEACRQDSDRIEQLIALELRSDRVPSSLSPHKGGWFTGGRVRMASAAAALLLLIVVSVLVLRVRTGTPDYTATIISTGADYNIVDLPLGDPVRGDEQISAAVRLKEYDGNRVVLQMMVDVFEGEESPSNVTIQDNAGEIVSKNPILSSAAETGRILLLIDTSTFAAGRYTIEVLDRFGASMGRATIEL